MYSIITILLVVMCLLYTTFGILGLLAFWAERPGAVRRDFPEGRKEPSYG